MMALQARDLYWLGIAMWSLDRGGPFRVPLSDAGRYAPLVASGVLLLGPDDGRPNWGQPMKQVEFLPAPGASELWASYRAALNSDGAMFRRAA